MQDIQVRDMHINHERTLLKYLKVTKAQRYVTGKILATKNFRPKYFCNMKYPNTEAYQHYFSERHALPIFP